MSETIRLSRGLDRGLTKLADGRRLAESTIPVSDSAPASGSAAVPAPASALIATSRFSELLDKSLPHSESSRNIVPLSGTLIGGALLTTLLTGLAVGSLIFVVSSGLTLVLGVLGIVNFAHGGLFLIGAYVAYQVQGGVAHSLIVFALLLVAAGLATAVVGVLVERFLLRPFYDHSPESMLLATYAVLLTMQGAVQMIWGSNQRTQPRPDGLGGAVNFGDTIVPRYDLMLIVVGLVVFAGLQWLLYATGFGRQVIAVAEDRYMASLLGIDTSRVFMATFGVATFLAGLGGALAAPTLSMTPNLATAFILYSFAVVIIGGFGSISGSLVASIVLGVLASFLGTYAPDLADYALYLPMLLILFFRPEGLRGRSASREVVIA